MRRRQLLAALAGVGSAHGLAGCAGLPAGDGGRAQPPGRTETGPGADAEGQSSTAPEGSRLARHGFPPDVCEAGVDEGFSIRAVVDPAFAADWSVVDPADRYGELTGGTTVVGLRRDGRARAYPVSVLWVHEIVNDRFGGPTLVSYCPLCLSGLVAERRVRGEPATFGVSGQLWRPPRLQVRASEASDRAFVAERGDWMNRSAGQGNATNRSADHENATNRNADHGNATNRSASDGNAGESATPESVRVSGNLVMYDEPTRSFWSQVLGRAICGPMTGTTLSVLPSTVTTWAEWRAEHPGTEVLLPAPASGTM